MMKPNYEDGFSDLRAHLSTWDRLSMGGTSESCSLPRYYCCTI